MADYKHESLRSCTLNVAGKDFAVDADGVLRGLEGEQAAAANSIPGFKNLGGGSPAPKAQPKPAPAPAPKAAEKVEAKPEPELSSDEPEKKTSRIKRGNKR